MTRDQDLDAFVARLLLEAEAEKHLHETRASEAPTATTHDFPSVEDPHVQKSPSNGAGGAGTSLPVESALPIYAHGRIDIDTLGDSPAIPRTKVSIETVNSRLTVLDGGKSPSPIVLPPFPTPAYEVARTGQEATRLVAQLQEFPTLALDCETTGLDPLQHRIRLVQVAAPTLAALFDLDTIPVTVLEPLFVADREFLVHNALF